MKKNMTALFIASALFSGMAMADASVLATNDSSQATLNFEGRVTSNACQVSTSDVNKTIELGEVTMNQLDFGSGSQAQSFNVELVNCDTNTESISYTLADVNGSESNKEYLIPESGDTSATGVGVFVEKSDGSTVTTGQEITLDNLGQDGNGTLSSQTIALKANIRKTDDTVDATPGSVNAKGTLTIRTTVVNP
ncbi:fimbrial protein [Escherichia marmotae]|uniref:fimbrial protein n=1 Tax=Escherichia marmotae TaxID=1499973 RepID=UPI0020009B4B|nr:fimbrial protein [Escherichia marmotae]